VWPIWREAVAITPGGGKFGGVTHADINNVLRKLVVDFEDRDGSWSLQYDDIPLHVVSDPGADRIRVIAPVPGADLADPSFLYRLLRANFETALDARYCVWRGTLWSAFLHPLAALTEEVFIDGMEQVVTLVRTTGDTFSSTGLRFGGDEGH
jgi:hypothetical protein